MTLTKLSEMLNSIPNIVSKNVILGGDFNLFFKTSLETQENPAVKQHLTKFMIRTLRVLELGASATGMKKEKNLLNSS